MASKRVTKSFEDLTIEDLGLGSSTTTVDKGKPTIDGETSVVLPEDGGIISVTVIDEIPVTTIAEPAEVEATLADEIVTTSSVDLEGLFQDVPDVSDEDPDFADELAATSSILDVEDDDDFDDAEGMMTYDPFTSPALSAAQHELLTQIRSGPDVASKSFEEQYGPVDQYISSSITDFNSIARADEWFVRHVSGQLDADPMFKSALQQLRTAHADYHKLATKVEKALGTEVVIKGMGHLEYHSTLENVLRHNHMMAHGISEVFEAFLQLNSDSAALGAIRQSLINAAAASINEDGAKEKSMQTLRQLLLVAMTSRNWLERSVRANEKMRDQEAKLRNQENVIKSLQEAYEAEVNNRKEERQKREARKNAGYSERYVLATNAGMMLGVDVDVITPDVRLGTENAVMVETMVNAFVFGKRSDAQLALDKLNEWWERGGRYRRSLTEGDVYPDKLMVHSITLTKE